MSRIVFDVGGVLYCSTKETLSKFPFFAHIGDGDFIDRDGAYFYYILNAMRGSSMYPVDPHIADHVREEAYFYGLQAYAQKIPKKRQ